MIDMVCPECGEDNEIDPADLLDSDCVTCEECETDFEFTYEGGKFVLGEALEEEPEDEDATVIDVEAEDEGDEEV